ncbi:Polyketide cyclase / dehydrase and lipid transport [Jatrophihabitans endophyticus]|uniref:Polyketide cyclase / dehydrase and lipid transport n=1 Tax=Jatrophihabitans endophyticus TaxID=1206085 RepID=A0A1M5IC90_9ACTN|nr:SRPBCC family protein [Jatrophihabitans endophyticus]SHG25882.1 Polyketide cyclase / dehydrase and lipid transport [Jatrophihabitans endophyticus]
MVHLHHDGIAEAPVAVAFAYIDDPAHVPTWMFGVERFEVRDPATPRGLGAVFDATFHVKPVKLASRVEITQWEQDRLIALTSIKGFSNSSVWRFEPDGPDRTKISVEFSYDLPGGIAGKALGRAVEPVVAMSVRHSDAALRKHIAEHHRAQRG